MSENKPRCFVIMPITMPGEKGDDYNGDADHFDKILNHLFVPAIQKAGFIPIPPKSTGSDIIHADIIKNLSVSELVLCDMSILNPNVFFEFGIRTALDKPVALVIDDATDEVPFDASMINFHRYKSSPAWNNDEQVLALTEHILGTYAKSKNRNALWKYFGFAKPPVAADAREAIPTLLSRLNDKYSTVRGAAVEALGNLYDPEVLPAILAATKDDSPGVRQVAVKALGKIGSSSVPERLTQISRGDESPEVRKTAIDVLGKELKDVNKSG